VVVVVVAFAFSPDISKGNDNDPLQALFQFQRKYCLWLVVEVEFVEITPILIKYKTLVDEEKRCMKYKEEMGNI
jgi:hypothetical protein